MRSRTTPPVASALGRNVFWTPVLLLIILTSQIALSTTIRAQGDLVCQPTVTTETEECPGNSITTFVRVVNGCPCDVDVTVHLPGNGAAILLDVKKNGGTKRDAIQLCSHKKGEFLNFDHKFSCPKDFQEKDGQSRNAKTNSNASNAAALNKPSWSELKKKVEGKAANADATNKANLEEIERQEMWTRDEYEAAKKQGDADVAKNQANQAKIKAAMPKEEPLIPRAKYPPLAEGRSVNVEHLFCSTGDDGYTCDVYEGDQMGVRVGCYDMRYRNRKFAVEDHYDQYYSIRNGRDTYVTYRPNLLKGQLDGRQIEILCVRARDDMKARHPMFDYGCVSRLPDCR